MEATVERVTRQVTHEVHSYRIGFDMSEAEVLVLKERLGRSRRSDMISRMMREALIKSGL